MKMGKMCYYYKLWLHFCYIITRLSRETLHMMYIQGSNIWLQVASRMQNKTVSVPTRSPVITHISVCICAGGQTTGVRKRNCGWIWGPIRWLDPSIPYSACWAESNTVTAPVFIRIFSLYVNENKKQVNSIILSHMSRSLDIMVSCFFCNLSKGSPTPVNQQFRQISFHHNDADNLL